MAALDFDPTAIEQMEVKTKICPNCGGQALRWYTDCILKCSRCDGVGEVEVNE